MTTDERKARFMAINASAPKIWNFLRKNQIAKGINWSGSSKGSMADAYANRRTLNNAEGPVLPESTLDALEDRFGRKGKK